MRSASRIRLFWFRSHTWIREHRRAFWIIVILAILIISGAVSAYILISRPQGVVKAPAVKVTEKPKPKPKYYSVLTGKLIDSESDNTKPVTCLMIENSPESRPQSGIKDSGVVFEAIAEGGITRFLVVYQQEKPQIIGPVRSVRPYYIDWAAAFDCSIGHIGGSSAALAEVRNGNYRDIDQFFNSGSYWRATDRYAPHNLYTSFDKLDALNTAKGYTQSAPIGFSRVDGKPIETPDATSITITVSSATFNSSYIYDSATNTYARSQGGAPHLDREAGQINPSVVIALLVNETTINDDGWHEQIVTIGQGEANIFQNGTEITAAWHKDSKTSQIVFTDATGADIPLVRGQTWITAVPIGKGSVSWL